MRSLLAQTLMRIARKLAPRTVKTGQRNENVISPNSRYELSTTWFESNRAEWDTLMEQLKPRTLLEIGSFEGASACYLIDTLARDAAIELHCIDTWEGSPELVNQTPKMSLVEERFTRNTELAIQSAANRVSLVVHKGPSSVHLPKLIVEGRQEHFDFIYVDGSHQAPDVLFDAVVAFKLLRPGGLMVFDDYLWRDPSIDHYDPLRNPKIAIDAFTNVNGGELKILRAKLKQLYVRKKWL